MLRRRDELPLPGVYTPRHFEQRPAAIDILLVTCVINVRFWLDSGRSAN